MLSCLSWHLVLSPLTVHHRSFLLLERSNSNSSSSSIEKTLWPVTLKKKTEEKRKNPKDNAFKELLKFAYSFFNFGHTEQSIARGTQRWPALHLPSPPPPYTHTIPFSKAHSFFQRRQCKNANWSTEQRTGLTRWRSLRDGNAAEKTVQNVRNCFECLQWGRHAARTCRTCCMSIWRQSEFKVARAFFF